MHPILIYGLNFWLFIANRQFHWTANSQFHQNCGERYENSDKKSVVTQQMCTFMNKVYCFHNKRNGHLQLDRDNHRCKCSHPADLKHREDIQSKKIGHSYIMTQFVILSTYLIWNFHAVITDEVANQGTLFHCRGRLWDKTRSHQEFFYTPHVWSWLFRFFCHLALPLPQFWQLRHTRSEKWTQWGSK